MEFKLGIEPRNEYLSFELMRGAMKLVQDIMLVKENENVVITMDTSTDKRVADAVAQVTYGIGAVPTVVNYATAPTSCVEPPAPVAAAIAKADVWIELTYAYLQHSAAYRAAIDFGTRYICLTGLDVEMLVKCVARIDVDTLVEMGEHLKARFEKADKIVVKSQNGTNITAYNKGRKVRHSGQKATQKGYPVMMGGQISWCPVEETISGTLVFDGALWPPYEIGRLQAPVSLTVKEGRIIAIDGGRDADVFQKWLSSFHDDNMYRIAHYSLGFNPGVTAVTGRIVEDERVFGCMEFGIGSQGAAIMGSFWNASAHTDGTILKPTILLDGELFEEDGVYQSPDIITYCRKLGVQGY